MPEATSPRLAADERAGEGIEPLPEGLVRALGAAQAYPEDPGPQRDPEHVQTHISHVFLSRQRAYKLRKAVAPGFLDFGTRALRNCDCLREVALNRRLSPDVYLGIAPIAWRDGRASVGAVGEALDPAAAEHCVVMRRLPAGCDALSMLERGALEAQHVERAARRLARFHREVGLGAPAPGAPEDWVERAQGPVFANLDLLEREPSAAPPEEVCALREAVTAAFAAVRERIRARALAGRIVDGHGDVHLQHVWFESSSADPLFVDCIEFSDALRQIDVASELAFLAMDLGYRGRADLAECALRSYAAAAGDYDLYGVVAYYLSYRAAVRAKVAAMAASESQIAEPQRERARESARAHLALARALLDPPRPPALVALCGLVGSGKSRVAAHLAAQLESAAVIASDRVRKQLAGIEPTDRSGPERGIYAREWTERVYDAMLEHAEPVLRSGRVAILDASFPRAWMRARAAERARACDVPLLFVEVCCEESVARERLERRARENRDASDAGPERLEISAREFEPFAPQDAVRRVVVYTDRPDGWAALRGALASLESSAAPARR